tara:strand:+ start:37009 stop:38076 length:1068 start_codon:yes stop_codon:yes gene_type:complete
MAARLSTAEINELLTKDDPRGHHDLLKNLPEDVDATLAAQRLVELLERSGYWFARNQRKQTPVPVILEVARLLGASLATMEGRGKEASVLLVERLRLRDPDEEIQDAWRSALQTMLDIQTTYGWGSKQRKAKLRALSEDAAAVVALQAAVVGCEAPSLDSLVVLALEGSDESLDALLPHFATSDVGRRFERLEQLRTHIPRDGSPADQLLADAEKQLAEHRDESPALEFATHLGFGRPKNFWFRYEIGTVARSPNGYNPRFRCIINVDSRTQEWFWVTVYEVEERRRTSFGNGEPIDELGLGTSTPETLPAWLASVAKALDCPFGPSHVSSSLRGKKRTILQDWFEADLRAKQRA